MTNKQTIDGVSRELLEQALLDANRLRFDTDKQVIELHALLDKPASYAHEWTDDGGNLLVCTACGAQEDHDPGWRDMETAPTDGTMVRLLVEFEEHSTDDADQAATIGANNFDNDDEDVWRFSGWCWSHDHFTEGKGTPVGWLPMLNEPITKPAAQPQGEVEPVAYLCRNIRHTIPSMRTQWEPITVAYAQARMHNKALAAEGKADESLLGDEFQPLYPHADSGEVERPRRLVDSREVERQQCIEECSAEVGALRAQLARRDALLRRIKNADAIYPGSPLMRTIDAAIPTSAEPTKQEAWALQMEKDLGIERLPADPKPRGEAVHQWSDDGGSVAKAAISTTKEG